MLPLRGGKKDIKARPLCFLLTSEGGLQVRSSVYDWEVVHGGLINMPGVDMGFG